MNIGSEDWRIYQKFVAQPKFIINILRGGFLLERPLPRVRSGAPKQMTSLMQRSSPEWVRWVGRLSEKFTQGELLAAVKNEDAVLILVAFSDVVTCSCNHEWLLRPPNRALTFRGSTQALPCSKSKFDIICGETASGSLWFVETDIGILEDRMRITMMTEWSWSYSAALNGCKRSFQSGERGGVHWW